jgi:hypothetical protein
MKKACLCYVLVAAVVVVVFVGCKKSNSGLQPMMVDGVALETTRFAQAFDTASPDLRAVEANIQLSIRYRQYVQALANLDKLLNNPALNEEQKKVVSAFTDQVKQLATKAQAAGAQ